MNAAVRDELVRRINREIHPRGEMLLSNEPLFSMGLVNAAYSLLRWDGERMAVSSTWNEDQLEDLEHAVVACRPA